jgi:hypothetical protein
MFCLWVQVNPQASRPEILKLSQESGTVCIIFGLICDVKASILALRSRFFVIFMAIQFP